jgi:GNAT superfamily N-acetyltransferase
MQTNTLEKISTREFTIELAQPTDIVEAAYITKVVLRHLSNTRSFHPDMFENLYEVFSSHVQARSLYILKKGNVCLGFITYHEHESSDSGDLSWKYDGFPLFYVSRIFVLPSWRNKGVGSVLLAYAEELAAEKGVKTIRIDALSDFEEGGLFISNDYRFAGDRNQNYGKLPVRCFEKTI